MTILGHNYIAMAHIVVARQVRAVSTQAVTILGHYCIAMAYVAVARQVRAVGVRARERRHARGLCTADPRAARGARRWLAGGRRHLGRSLHVRPAARRVRARAQSRKAAY